jgi:acetyltransferase-like isoleucine patch superfamily enzyme
MNTHDHDRRPLAFNMPLTQQQTKPSSGGSSNATVRTLGRLTRVRLLLDEWRDSTHLRFSIVNALLVVTPPFVSGYVRGRGYRWAGMRLHPGAFIMGNVLLIGGRRGHVRNVSMGNGSVVSTNCTMNSDAEISIGDRVTIGPYVKLYTSSHDLGPGSQRCQPDVVARPIVIESGCWLAVGVTVLPGVTIGHGSVIAAGAVVDRDIPPDSYVQGVPATVVRKLPLGNR